MSSSYHTGVFIYCRYSIDSGGVRRLVFFRVHNEKRRTFSPIVVGVCGGVNGILLLYIAVVPRSRFTMVDVFCRRRRAVDARRFSVGGEEYRSTKKELSCVISYTMRPGRRKTRNRPRPRISARRKDREYRWREDAISSHTHTATFILYVPTTRDEPTPVDSTDDIQ